MRKLVVSMCAMALSAASALADLPRLDRQTPQFVLPKRLARISSDLKRIGPWIEYKGGVAGTACSTGISYDAFEPDLDDVDADGQTNDPQDGYYGLDCGFGGDRWLFVTYCDPFQVDDMGVPADQAGVLTDRVEFLWRWNPFLIDGSPSESCLMIVFTTEDVSLTCTAPSASGTFPGVIYDFGDLLDGFWYTDVDLCLAGLDHELPSVGTNATGCADADATILGGNILIGATEIIGTTIVLGKCSQPGLWGTKNSCNLLPGTSPYYQGPIHWDDSFPTDGSHDPAAECFSYALGICPDPLGWAVVFYGEGEPCSGFTCGDANCDGRLDGADFDPFFLGLIDLPAWQALFPLCDALCVLDTNLDGRIDNFDIEPFFIAIGKNSCGGAPTPGPAESTLRLFFSTAGLSDTGDTNSPAEDPSGDLGANLNLFAGIGERARIYVWAQMINMPIGTQKWIGVSLKFLVTGAGAEITDWNFWNYFNLFPSRWTALATETLAPNGRELSNINLLAAPGDFGVSDSGSPLDEQYNAAARATLIGYIEVAGSPGQIDVFVGVDEKGIVREGGGPPPGEDIFLGWGDEADGIQGGSFGVFSSMPDATVFFTSDPCAGFLCGDANCDGELDGADIDPFFLALGEPDTWQDKYPACDRTCAADVNGDGAVDGADIDAFFDALDSGSCGG